LVATINVFSPYQVLTHPFTLKPRDRKPPALGPTVPVAAAHLSPATNESALQAAVNGAGLRTRGKDGLLAHDTTRSNMWLGAWTTNLSIEFELAEPAALETIQVWNYNADWQTASGIGKADISVSADGTTWQTVLRGAAFGEAQGTEDYDEPTVLNLGGAMARKVRFENIVPLSAGGEVGLSEVVFHKAGLPAELSQPQSGK